MMQRWEFREALAMGTRAVELSAQVLPEIRAEALIVCAAAGWRVQDPLADARCREAESLARIVASDTLMLILAMRAAVEERRNEFDAYERTLLESADIASKALRPEFLFRATQQTARLHALVGRFDKAFTYARSAGGVGPRQVGPRPAPRWLPRFVPNHSLIVGAPAAARLLHRYVDSPAPGATTLSIWYPRITLARALLEGAPEASVKVGPLLQGALDHFRSMGPYVYSDGLVHELMWRTIPGCPAPLDPILAEAEQFLSKDGPRLTEMGRSVLRLHVALAHLHAGNPQAALVVLSDANPSAGTARCPSPLWEDPIRSCGSLRVAGANGRGQLLSLDGTCAHR